MKRRLKAFAEWLRDSGAWLALMLSAMVGVLLGSYAARGSGHVFETVEVVMAFVTAAGLVYHDMVRKANPEARRKKLFERCYRMFLAGTTARVGTAAIGVAAGG